MTSSRRQILRITHLHASRLNVGDNALVISTYNEVQRHFNKYNCRFYDVSSIEYSIPGEPIEGFLPLYEYRKPKHWIKLYRYLLQSRIVLIGGGDLLGSNPEFLGIALIARALGLPVIFYSIGVVLDETSWSLLKDTKLTLSLCNKIIVRENESYNELIGIGISPEKVVKAVDIVFTLGAEDENRRIKNSGINIGVSIRPGGSYREFSEKQLITMAAALDQIIEINDVIITFFNG